MFIDRTIKNLEGRGFKVTYFETGEEASEYLVSSIQNTTVGIGGSKTAEELGLYEKLTEAGNEVYWHWKTPGHDTLLKENSAKVFITSANAIAETGEILNIDGRGNRLAGQVFGQKKVYIVAGTNKIEPDFNAALFRARNTAAVTNGKRFDCNIPCKIDNKCHDCRAKDRICNALLVLWGPMMDMEMEIILINEELGY